MKLLSKILCSLALMSASSVFADWVKEDLDHPNLLKISIARNVLSVYVDDYEKWENLNPSFCRFKRVVDFIRRYDSNHSSIDHFGCLELPHSHITILRENVLSAKMVDLFLRDFEFSDEKRREAIKEYKAYLRLQRAFISNWIPFTPDPYIFIEIFLECDEAECDEESAGESNCQIETSEQ